MQAEVDLLQRRVAVMLAVRHATGDLLVLGMSRTKELTILALFLGGLFLTGLCFATGDVREHLRPAVLLVLWTALAGIALFCHEQLILDRSAGLLVHRRPLRRRRTLRFEDVDHIELFAAWGRYHDCKIALKDGSRFRIARGRVPGLIWLAQSIASFLRVPLDSRRIV